MMAEHGIIWGKFLQQQKVIRTVRNVDTYLMIQIGTTRENWRDPVLFFTTATSRSPGLPEPLATANDPGMWFWALPVIKGVICGMESLTIETNTMEKMLLQRAASAQRPINGSLELLPLCNMNCDMCYVRLSHAETEKKGGSF